MSVREVRLAKDAFLYHRFNAASCVSPLPASPGYAT